MTVFQFYFIIAGAILLSKFLFNICTFNRLKLFVNENRKVIDELMKQDQCSLKSLKYSDLIIYHFSSNSVKYSNYSEEMMELLIQDISTVKNAMYFLFALFWVVSVPCVLLCKLIECFGKRFENFAKSILS